jgi:hypothetical protein
MAADKNDSRRRFFLQISMQVKVRFFDFALQIHFILVAGAMDSDSGWSPGMRS